MQNLHPAIGVYGFPKSGNTWIQGVLGAVGEQVKPGYTQYDIYITRSRNESFNVHPLIEVEDKPAIVFKSHDMYKGKDKLFPDAEQLGISHLSKAMVIKRNPFDMLLSFLNYAVWSINKARQANETRAPLERYFRENLGASDSVYEELLNSTSPLDTLLKLDLCDKALQDFVDADLGISVWAEANGTWYQNIKSWEQQSDFEVLSIRYEDLIKNLPPQITALAEYLDIPEERLERAFDARKIATEKVHDADKKSNQVSFFNKCTACYFTEYFSPEAIDAALEAKSKQLKEVGYGDIENLCFG